VKRLHPPMLRAGLCIVAILSGMAVAILLFANLAVIEARADAGFLPIELVGTLGTGILATIAAFHLSLPDRSPRWALLPLPALAVWLAGSGLGCVRHFLSGAGNDWSMRSSWHCVLFICGVGLPLMVAMLLVLWRARPLAPAPVAIAGGLAAAAFAAFLLEFFHPFDISVMDLTLHAAAVGAVVWVSGVTGNRLLAKT
jgi:hypothetical protein